MAVNARGPVVVGVDGTEGSRRALAYAVWEARRRDAWLHIVHAFQPSPMWGPASVMLNEHGWVADWVRDLLAKSKAEANGIDATLVIDTAAVIGGPAAVLVDQSRTARLVVVGTQASPGFVGRLSGSVAAQVAAHAEAPVIVLRPGTDEQTDVSTFGQHPVMVGIDGSDESLKALAFGVDEALARGVDLHTVYVWSVMPVHDAGPIVPDSFDFTEMQQKAERLLGEATAGWAERWPDLKIHRRVVHDIDPVRALAAAAEDAGLLVVGSRGHGGFAGLRLGSTVDALIRTADTPIAVVRGVDE